MFEDEASFWVDGTLHQTWARTGKQPHVDTYGERKTAHIYGAISLQDAKFRFQFATGFNAQTFHMFLKHLVQHSAQRKVFLIIDSAPWHNLDEDGVRWLNANRAKIELSRLPKYSPEFNPMEGVWKLTRKRATHNRFFATPDQRDMKLRKTFKRFQQHPLLILPQVSRFQ